MAIRFGPKPPREQALAIVAEASESVVAELREMLATPKRKRAPNGTFDRTAYQRELMRKRRAEGKA